MLKYLRNIAGISVIDQTLISGVNFLAGIYLAYKLGITAFGQYSLILLVVQFCIEIQRSTINSPLFIFSAEQGNDHYLKSIYPLQLSASVILALLAGGFTLLSGMFFEKWQISHFALVTAIFSFAKLQQEFYRRYFFAVHKPQKSLFIDGSYSFLFITGLIFIVRYKTINIDAILVTGSITSFLPLLFCKISFNLSRLALQETWSKHYHFSKWLFASSIATYFSSNLLLFIGSAIIGSSAAGILKLSQYIMGFMIILYQALDNIIPHQLAKFVYINDQSQLKSYFYKYIRIVFSLTIIHGAGIYLFLDSILRLINNGDYSPEQHDIAIGYIIFSFLVTTTYSLQYLLRAYRQTKPIFLGSIIAAILMILTGKSLILHYGVMGILLGFFLSQFMIIILYSFYAYGILTSDEENRPHPVG